MRAFVFGLALLPSALMAQGVDLPDDPTATLEEFEAAVAGKTMLWAEEGKVYGVEEYLPGRRVGWRRGDEPCRYGEYYAKDGLICFQYDKDGIDHCWQMWRRDVLFLATQPRYPNSAITIISESGDSLNCPAPLVGVKY